MHLVSFQLQHFVMFDRVVSTQTLHHRHPISSGLEPWALIKEQKIKILFCSVKDLACKTIGQTECNEFHIRHPNLLLHPFQIRQSLRSCARQPQCLPLTMMTAQSAGSSTMTVRALPSCSDGRSAPSRKERENEVMVPSRHPLRLPTDSSPHHEVRNPPAPPMDIAHLHAVSRSH